MPQLCGLMGGQEEVVAWKSENYRECLPTAMDQGRFASLTHDVREEALSKRPDKQEIYAKLESHR